MKNIMEVTDSSFSRKIDNPYIGAFKISNFDDFDNVTDIVDAHGYLIISFRRNKAEYRNLRKHLEEVKTFEEFFKLLGISDYVAFYGDTYDMLRYLHEQQDYDLPTFDYNPLEDAKKDLYLIGETYFIMKPAYRWLHINQ